MRLVQFLIVSMAVSLGQSFAEEHKKENASHEAESKKDGEKKDQDKTSKKKTGAKSDSNEALEIQAPPPTVVNPGGYIHSWLTQPSLKGYDLAGGTIIFIPKPGLVSVTLFLASWCTVCQEVISHINELDRKYSSYGVDFYYAFSHDMPTDVRGFVRERKLNPEKTLIISEQVLREFHDPILPTVYISDRKGFVAGRFNYDNKVTPDLSEFKKRLEGLLLY